MATTQELIKQLQGFSPQQIATQMMQWQNQGLNIEKIQGAMPKKMWNEVSGLMQEAQAPTQRSGTPTQEGKHIPYGQEFDQLAANASRAQPRDISEMMGIDALGKWWGDQKAAFKPQMSSTQQGTMINQIREKNNLPPVTVPADSYRGAYPSTGAQGTQGASLMDIVNPQQSQMSWGNVNAAKNYGISTPSKVGGTTQGNPAPRANPSSSMPAYANAGSYANTLANESAGLANAASQNAGWGTKFQDLVGMDGSFGMDGVVNNTGQMSLGNMGDATSSAFSGFGNWLGDNIGAISGGLEAVGGIMGGLAGMKQADLAKDQLQFQKDTFAKNWANQVALTNTSLRDRQAARASASSYAQDVDSYMKDNEVK